MASAPPQPATEQSLHLAHAGPGDHPLIQRLFLLSGRAPLAADFPLQLEEPGYEPQQRIVVRDRSDVVAHGRVSLRQMAWGAQQLRVALLREVVIRPEYRSVGLAPQLVNATLEQAHASGAHAVFWNTSAASLAAEQGFVPLDSATCASARPRDVLAALTAAGHIQHDARQSDLPRWPGASEAVPINIRLWRHYELEALMRLYDSHCQRAWGALHRNAERWRWLISRHGYDRLYVAIDGPDSWELDHSHRKIVGYAIMREAEIVELVVAPGRDDVAARLLARACGDAVEHDAYRVHFEAPPDHPLHQVFATASGAPPAAPTVEAWHVHLFDPVILLRHLLAATGDESPLPPYGELGLEIAGRQSMLRWEGDQSETVVGTLGRQHLALSKRTLARLIVGSQSPGELAGAGKLTSSSTAALQLAELLFAPRPWWLPRIEDLPGHG